MDATSSSVSIVIYSTLIVWLMLQLVSTLKADQLDLAELLMNSLLGRQVDNSYIARMYSIRGLGNMADIEGNQVHKCNEPITLFSQH